MNHITGGVVLLVVALLIVGWPADASGGEVESVSADEEQRGDERGLWPPMPGVAIKTGGGMYHSVPCGCVDRGVWTNELAGRLHFGHLADIEATLQRGTMLLGGRFPSSGWSVAGRLAVIWQNDAWWDGLTAGAGYRRWQVMGMRSPSTGGPFGVVNWAVELFPHVHAELEAVGGRTFGAMPHWHLEGRLGVSLRF